MCIRDRCVHDGSIVYFDVAPAVELARMVGAAVARDSFVGAAFQKSGRRESHAAKCSKRVEREARNEQFGDSATTPDSKTSTTSGQHIASKTLWSSRPERVYRHERSRFGQELDGSRNGQQRLQQHRKQQLQERLHEYGRGKQNATRACSCRRYPGQPGNSNAGTRANLIKHKSTLDHQHPWV